MKGGHVSYHLLSVVTANKKDYENLWSHCETKQ